MQRERKSPPTLIASDPADERWRDVEGWPGYEVSDMGRVRSWKQRSKGRVWIEDRSHSPTYLRPDVRNGYPSVVLSDKELGRTWESVHNLVLIAFVGRRPPGQQGAHRSGDKLDNRLINLRWATPASNNADKHAHGTAQFGSRIGNAKLDFSRAEEIRRLHREGSTRAELRVRFEVGKSTIDNVINRKCYTRPE